MFKGNKFIEKHVISKVYFRPLDDLLIEEYVKSGSPLDKAGAYGVQDNDKFPIIEKVIGSVNNVIGFPIEEIEKDFLEMKKD